MYHVSFLRVGAGVLLESKHLGEGVAVRRSLHFVEHLEDLVLVEDVRLLTREVVGGEHEVIVEAEGVDDVLGGVHGVVEGLALRAVGLQGVGVVEEDGDQVARAALLLAGGDVGLREGKCQRGDAEYAKGQHDELLQGLLTLGLLLDLLQHFDVGKINCLVTPEIEEVYDDRYQDGRKAYKEQWI